MKSTFPGITPRTIHGRASDAVAPLRDCPFGPVAENLVPMESTQRKRPLAWRLARFALLALLLLAALVLGRFLWTARDRFPGYRVEVAIDAASALREPRPLRVGFGTVDITPDVSDPRRPVWIAGFSSGKSALAVHDPLAAAAIAIDNGHARVAIVALDAIGFFHDDVIRVREAVPPDWKLDYVVVCSTHNHSTPDLMGLWGPDPFHSGVDPAYRDRVIRSARDAIGAAVTNLAPARMAMHHVPVDPEGLVKDTRKPIVFDADLRFLHFTDATTGRTLGTLVGWGNHPETPWSKNRDITADFPGVLRKALAEGIPSTNGLFKAGLGGQHVFVNGAVGGLMTTHPSTVVTDPVTGERIQEPSHAKTRALGHQLALRVLERIASEPAPSVASVPLTVHARTLDLPLDNPMFLLGTWMGVLERGYSRWLHFRTEVALLTLGDASFACVPGEIYPEIVNGGIVRAPGGDFDVEPVEVPPLRQLMPGKVPFLLGLANDEIGYIIPRSEWDQRAPHLFGESAPYGEINSCGPRTAPLLHAALRDLIEQQRLTQPSKR